MSGIGPVLVRGSPVGPAATAFWRLAIALPFALWTGRFALTMPGRDIGLALISGSLLAADLVFWNNAILRTSVMEATVLVMMFPLIVAVGEIWIFARRLKSNSDFWWSHCPDRHGRHRHWQRGRPGLSLVLWSSHLWQLCALQQHAVQITHHTGRHIGLWTTDYRLEPGRAVPQRDPKLDELSWRLDHRFRTYPGHEGLRPPSLSQGGERVRGVRERCNWEFDLVEAKVECALLASRVNGGPYNADRFHRAGRHGIRHRSQSDQSGLTLTVYNRTRRH